MLSMGSKTLAKSFAVLLFQSMINTNVSTLFLNYLEYDQFKRALVLTILYKPTMMNLEEFILDHRLRKITLQLRPKRIIPSLLRCSQPLPMLMPS